MPCILAVVRERGGLCVSDVVQVSDMVEAGRATASDLFSIFGYTVNKVVVGSRANCDFHICTAAEATPAGAPLLVLPLSRCWTASSAEATQDTSNLAQAGQAHPDTESDSCVKAECPNLGPALARAADRRKTGRTQTTGAAKEPPAGAESLLEAGSTRIALQLLWELRRQRAGASPSSEDDSVVSARRRASALGRAVHLQLLGPPGLVAGHAGGSPMPRAPGLVRVSRLETLLAWGRRDLDALRGSPWFDEATRRQAEVVFELRSLLAELGPQVAAELGLLSSDAPSSEASEKFGELSRGTLECFAWARQVLQQYGLTFLLPPGHAAGSQLQLLAPGLELLRSVGPETEARCQEGPDVSVLRLELGLRGGPALVLYAGRSLEEGDPIHFSHGACSQGGFRLLRGLGACGPEVKPWDAVEVLLRLPVHSKDTAPGAQLWEVLQALQDGLSSSEPGASSSQLPGDCLPPNTSESCHEASRLVSVHAQRPAASSAAAAGDPEVVVRVPLRRGHLPCKAALVQLGLLICAHPDRMQRVLREEKGVVNPLGPDACERRALAYLGKRVQWALEEYPSCPGAAAEELECTWRSEQIATSTSLSTKAGDLGEGGEFRHGVENRQLPPRRLRALWLVATERQLLVEAAAAIQHRLSSATSQVAGKLSGQGEEGEAPHELPGFGRSSRTVLAPRLLSGLLVPGSKSQELSQLLARLQGCTRAAANLGRRFRELHGRDEDDVDAREEGDALQRELLVVSQLLSSSPLGDPLAPEVALQRGVVPAADGTVRAQGQALETLLRASLASLKWAQQCAGSELGVAESESSENANEQLCDVLLLSAATHMRLGDLDAASTELREALAKCSAETRTCRLQAFSEAVVELDISQLTWPPVRKPEANSISSGPEASSSSSSSSFSARCSLPGVDQVALAMARKCAAGLAARSERVLFLAEPTSGTSEEEEGRAGDGSGSSAVLRDLRKRMQDLGYMNLWRWRPWPDRLPPARDLALSLGDWSKNLRAKDLEKDLKDLVDLFLLRQPLSLERAIGLLRPEAATLLLECCALCCFDPLQGCLLSPAEAVAAAAASCSLPGESSLEVLANVALWPVSEDLLVAVDFEQVVSCSQQEEPVPLLGRDSLALLAAASASESGSSQRLLDFCCGCGVQGLAALRASRADHLHVTFVDENPRALRFARFAAHFNGLQANVSFVGGFSAATQTSVQNMLQEAAGASQQQGGCGFQHVLANLARLPNPAGTMAGGDACYEHCTGSSGVGTGVEPLQAPGIDFLPLLGQLLAPGGHLLAVAWAPGSAEALRLHLERRLSEAAEMESLTPSRGLHATVFRDTAMPLEAFVRAATPNCTELQRLRFEEMLRCSHSSSAAHGASEVVLLLWADDAEGGGCSSPLRVELHSEHSGLWSDEEYLRREVSSALEGFRLAFATQQQTSTMYSLDWDDGLLEAETAGLEAETLGKTAAGGRGYAQATDKRRAASSAKAQWKPTEQQSSKSRRVRELEGATWEDLTMEPLLGFSLPALCEVLWRQDSSSSQPVAVVPGATHLSWGLLELRGCSAPPEVASALLACGCQDRLFLSEGSSELHVQRGHILKLASGASWSSKAAEVPHARQTGGIAKLDEFDVLVLPMMGWRGQAQQPHSFCVGLSHLLQALTSAVVGGSRPLRLILLSSTCLGPGSASGQRSGGQAVAAQAPALGLVRSLRTEVPQMPLLWLDTDAHGQELQEQLVYELALAHPAGGATASSQERALALLAHNREVAYRQGQRWLPRLDLSAAGPVYAGRTLPSLCPLSERGVALVTGGIAGLGLAAAEALAELGGIRHLVLSSRSGQPPPDVEGERIRRMEERFGVKVVLEQCDVSAEREVQQLLDRIRTSHGPLRVVVHASGLLEDCGFSEPGFAESLRRVFEPKALGAWHLHRHSLGDQLLAFVLCSSVAALVGSPGQANYAAANAYLDELAWLRFSQGLPAVSLQWPAISDEEPEGWLETEEGGFAAAPESRASASCIGLGEVRQVFKLAISGCKSASASPVQAVLPGAYLTRESSPAVTAMLEPLLLRAARARAAEKRSAEQEEQDPASSAVEREGGEGTAAGLFGSGIFPAGKMKIALSLG
ncbi:unnamed protein product [Polarella glacialis]|uniref:Ketoreductase domain-containing protein n=1 Tax=Polarella glacialis TaxID=89957 RepID=A0A813M030_POLGL|nr:unnamed protein product [Polarella glacialis]